MGKKKNQRLVTGIETIKDMIDDRLSLIEGDELYWGPVNEDYQLSRYDDLLCAIELIEDVGIDLLEETGRLLKQKHEDEKRLERDKEIEKLKAEGKWNPPKPPYPTLGSRTPMRKTAYYEWEGYGIEDDEV